MYSLIRDYGSCLDYVNIIYMLNLDIFCVIFELYYLDYNLIIVYFFL